MCILVLSRILVLESLVCVRLAWPLLQVWIVPSVREFVPIWQRLDFWGSVNDAACVCVCPSGEVLSFSQSPISIIHLLQCVFMNWWGNNKGNKRGESEWFCLCIVGVAFNIWPTFGTPFSEFQLHCLLYCHISLLSLTLSLCHTVLFHHHFSSIKLLLVFSYTQNKLLKPFFCSLFPLMRRWG